MGGYIVIYVCGIIIATVRYIKIKHIGNRGSFYISVMNQGLTYLYSDLGYSNWTKIHETLGAEFGYRVCT